MEPSTTLSGKIALVTGASRGIGQATAELLARRGADVVVHYHRQQAAAEATARHIVAGGRRAWVAGANLESLEDIDRLFAQIRQWTGRLDILVANAAATAFKPVLELKPHHWERTYALIVRGFLALAQQAAALMPAGGRMVALSGHGVEFTLPLYANIGSAKAAVETLVRYLAYELGPRGITVNAVAPGVVETDSARFYMGDRYEAFRATVARQTPLRRLATPDDIAEVIAFLASDGARFVTGQTLRVDGGLTLTSGPFEAEAAPDV